MNSYPPELIVQLAPLMFVAGLDGAQDPFIARLRNVLLSQRKQAIYQPQVRPTTFHVQFVDKAVSFPPTRQHLPHSPLSPLSPSSPLHPDGIIAPIWLRKHTTLLPCVFVLFLHLSELLPDKDAERDNDAALSALISDRKRLTSERNVKLTVVLLASRRLLDDPALEPRLTFIRRQSGLDARASLFVLSPVANQELTDFVNSLQAALADVAAEYYAAHGRRVRRKRNKHSHPSVAPPALPPIAQTVPIPRPLRPEGWAVRYSYKLAAFAEFRAEFEVALKHYQEAYNSLCLLFSSPGPVPPSTFPSSPPSLPSLASLAPLPPRTKRWAEAKVLSDCINIKIVKLFLYNNEHALACSQHHSHVALFSEMSERRWGIGEASFEFWSWVGRQYRVLAELIDQGLRSTLVLPSHAYKPPKSVHADLDQLAQKSQSLSIGTNPMHSLLHSGYYYYAAARCAEMRRKRFLVALQAEAESKPVALMSPGFANEKKVDHLGLVVELYTKAYEVFKSAATTTTGATGTATEGGGTGGGRQMLWIAYRIAETYKEGGKYDLAIRFFDRIAKTYRNERWIELLKAVLEGWFESVVGLGGQVEEGVRVLLELIGLGGSEMQVDDLMGFLKTTKPSVTDKPLVVELTGSFSLFETEPTFYAPSVKLSELSAFQIRMRSKNAWREGVGSLRVYIKHGGREECLVLRQPLQQVEREERGAEEPRDEENGSGKIRLRKIDLGEIVLGMGRDELEGEEEGSAKEEKVIKELEADLRWDKDETVVLCGLVRCWCVGVVEVSKVVVVIEEPQNGWSVEVPIVSASSSAITKSATPPKVGWWLSSLDPPRFVPLQRDAGCRSLMVKHREHLIHVSFSHNGPAYVDEEYAVDVEVRNLDDRPLDVTLGFLVRPGEDESVVNWIIVDGERSASLSKGVRLGVVEPGGCAIKKVWLVCTDVRGERLVDVEVLTKAVEGESDEEKSGEEDEGETMEHLELLAVNAVEPFRVEYEVFYTHSAFSASSGETTTGLADLKAFDASWWDERRGIWDALVCGRVIFGGLGSGDEAEKREGERERVIVIEKVELERAEGSRARILDSDVDSNVGPDEYIEGDEFCVNCRVNLCDEDGGDDDESFGGLPGDAAIQQPGRYCVMWHRVLPDGSPGPSVKTILELPTLRSPSKVERDGTQENDEQGMDAEGSSKANPNANGLVALLRVPPIGKLHEPMGIELILRNGSAIRTANVSVSIGASFGPGTGEAETIEGGGGSQLQQAQQQFVVAGIKHGRLGVVLPGEEVRVAWILVPLECGRLRVPRVKVVDWRGAAGDGAAAAAAGEEVEVFDAGRCFGSGDEEVAGGVDEGVGSVLVLP